MRKLFEQLTPQAQQRAIEGVKCMHRHWFVIRKENYLALRAKQTDIHKRVNDGFMRGLYRQLVNTIQTINKDKTRTRDQWEAVIIGNLMEFDENGRAYSYMLKKFF